ncbi:signal transduction protein [Catellatospora sp. TT07R-123]|uniref:CBS domain-containing protein n=1 Tax=Catellatospora sp. TT07R-123 TaxID=2733863 RepID=UPI001B077553|nr:CBS domain-containing protein [Catellatospora sp. TT07R-123]GHJ44358.1 signal transduction protein [Catellatospora sp. TT07R-123]
MTTEQLVRDIMTANPVCLPDTASLTEAAEQMARRDIGDVLVLDGDGRLEGIVTDRDIVVRGMAAGREPGAVHLRDILSDRLVMVGADEPVSAAVELMREHALRRLPVTADGHAVGIVSLGDLAADRDPRSALAEISEAPPSR